MTSLEEEDPRVLDNDTKPIDQEIEVQNEIAPGNDEKCDGDTADDDAEVHANVRANIADNNPARDDDADVVLGGSTAVSVVASDIPSSANENGEVTADNVESGVETGGRVSAEVETGDSIVLHNTENKGSSTNKGEGLAHDGTEDANDNGGDVAVFNACGGESRGTEREEAPGTVVEFPEQKRRQVESIMDTDDVEPQLKRHKVAESTGQTRQLARRKTKTWGEREKVMKTHSSVENEVPPLPEATFDTWEAFTTALKSYVAKYYLHYRVRSSETRDKHNSRAGATAIPAHLTHSYKRMWCTHTATQAGRGAGRRGHDQRFTGCAASFVVCLTRIVESGIGKWKVCIDREAEISQHNHKTTKTILESYRGAKSMPLPRQVREDLGLLTDMKTSTADVNRYLSNKLGGCFW
ncbi:hypothetical protein V7S43_013254 [Phytophthora oleae]|uniref:PiggyBac transposable element-derived protein domain-containing protein n=1 Tax=Phytophthora oleae TaxID=2107226 RepID=A0ABD3F7L6_9STRA